MPKLKVRKVTGPENDGFTETLKYYVMHQANVHSNHNKYFTLEIQKHTDGRYRVFTHYGRLGITNVYEVRDTVDGKPIYDEDVAIKEFESIHKKKLRGKSAIDEETGEKIRECYVDVDVVSPTVGSVNIRGNSTKTVTVKKTVIDTSVYTDSRVIKIMDQFVEENIHNIVGSTSLTYTANGFETPLGPVTKEHVDKARIPLDGLNKLMGKKGSVEPSDRVVQRLNSEYFSLIPKPFSRKITEEDMLLTSDALQAEYDILDQLATSVKLGAAMSGSAAQRMNALGVEIAFLEDLNEVKKIKRYVRESKASNHHGTNVWDFDVKAIYKIKIPGERSRYEAVHKRYGNIQEVFHGTQNSNVLSILSTGLNIPPATAGHVTGRAFGPGIYGATNSTKSMNYCTSFWGGRGSKYRNIFMFLANFAMGKTFECYYGTWARAPRGYDSTWAKKGRGLYNPELIVHSVDQCTLRYLIELEK